MATAIPENRAPFTVEEIARATGGRVVHGGGSTTGVSTDSRAIAEGSAFVALTGDKFDGHAFLASAVTLGARTLVVSRDDVGPWKGKAPAVVRVEDTRKALGDLARAHRARWGQGDPPRSVVAITGSAGKTTTKAVLAGVLEAMAPRAVHATVGNLNNDIGVPMTLFGLTAAHRYAVVEMGTNARGEIANLASIAEPNAGVLTLVAAAHTERIGTVADVAIEKGALLAALPPAGLAVANGDDPRAAAQLARSAAKTKVTYGFDEGVDYRVSIVESRGVRGDRLRILRRNGAIDVESPLLGDAGALAVVASVAVAEWAVGRAATPAEIESGLATVAASSRLALVRLGDETLVIDDSYNANPASMKASLGTAEKIAAREKRRLVVVLGEMRELGHLSAEEHDALGDLVARGGAASVVGVAGDAQRIVERAARSGKTASFAPSSDQAAPLVLAAVKAGDVVLVKGSRGVATEKIVQALVAARGCKASGGAA